jgi:large subunit ribosomal protein L9
MEVILLERIEKLGQMGDVVNVKPGFARNFLLPLGKALRANEINRSHFEVKRAQLEAVNLEQCSEAQAIADKMIDVNIVLVRQAGDAGQLYGSVSARDISDALTNAGYTISRTQVRQSSPIKNLGLHLVSVYLHPEVIIEITANVARSAEEAAIQSETGMAMMSQAEADAKQEAEERETVFSAPVEAIAEEAKEAVTEEAVSAPSPPADA